MSDLILTPYIFFQGQCEEALTTYATILDGQVQILQRYDNPAMQVPEAFKNKVLHSEFRFSNNLIYASDVMGDGSSGIANVALSISLTSPDKGTAIFNQLAAGGQVGVPFAKQFWGAWHGNLTDKFGVRWMVNCE